MTKCLTRREYDFLIEHRTSWMASNWKRFHRQWSYGGVRITGSVALVSELIELLETTVETVNGSDR